MMDAFSSQGEVFSDKCMSAPNGSKENSAQPLCTIKESEEDYENNLMDKLK